MALEHEGDFVRGPRQLLDVMRGYPGPWFVAGGWAIDLFLDRLTRPHKDIEVAIFRRDQAYLPVHFDGWSFELVSSGRPVPWTGGQYIAPPAHEIHARRQIGQSATELTHVEVLLNDRDGDDWVFRRDHRVTVPADSIGYTAPAGLPALIPEIVLLYKAKEPTREDERDFEAAAPNLHADGRAWLRWAIEQAHPGHRWLDWLGEEGA